jgi:Ribbon-helix-helix protein, copG family
MPILKFNIDQASAYRFRQAALREGRTVADFVKRCAEKGIAGSPPVAMPDAEIAREERNAHGHTTVAAYLSGPLAKVIKELAAQTGRSQSHVMRDLIRCEARRRGLLSTPNAAPTSPTA